MREINAEERACWLRERRKELGLTQRQTADRAQITLQQYQKFESGSRNIMNSSFLIACRILRALELDIETFYLGGSSERVVPDESTDDCVGEMLITGGFLYVITEDEIAAVDLEKPSCRMLIGRDGQVLESSMQRIQEEIVLQVWQKNGKREDDPNVVWGWESSSIE